VSVSVRNTGSVLGSEVLQLYVQLPDLGITTPRLQLRGFQKARNIAPDATTVVQIHLDRYAVSYWDETSNRWRGRAGKYGVFVGRSSDDLPLQGEFELEHNIEWTGV